MLGTMQFQTLLMINSTKRREFGMRLNEIGYYLDRDIKQLAIRIESLLKQGEIRTSDLVWLRQISANPKLLRAFYRRSKNIEIHSQHMN